MKKKPDPLADLRNRLAKLRVAYDKYFLGIDKREPIDQRRDFKRRLNLEKSGVQSTNSARRFALQQLTASVISYEAHWNRTCKKIEEGTYHRQLKRAARKQRQEEVHPNTPHATALRPSQQPDDGIFESFTAIQKSLGVTQVSKDQLMTVMQSQREQLKNKLGCLDVEFRVEKKEGKPILRAKPIYESK